MMPKPLVQKVIEKRNQKWLSEKYREVEMKRSKGPLIFLMATPNHGNIGDQAIAVAERKFLKDQCSEYMVVEISFDEYEGLKEKLSELIIEKDILAYHGGGNMGIQYFECESVFRDLIQRYPNNTIIGFPQTIFYPDNEDGQKEFQRSKEIYNAHAHLHLFAREQTSYEIMKNAYTNVQVSIVPDIVLYLDEQKHQKREGVMTCLRNDVEKSLSNEDSKTIFACLQARFHTIHISDTVKPIDHVEVPLSSSIFYEKIEEFQKAELIVTDRLHGMVFAYLTNTPCVVFSNYNYKVAGVYEWIKDNSYIRFIQQVDELENAIDNVLSNKIVSKRIDLHLFDPLAKAFQTEK